MKTSGSWRCADDRIKFLAHNDEEPDFRIEDLKIFSWFTKARFQKSIFIHDFDDLGQYQKNIKGDTSAILLKGGKVLDWGETGWAPNNLNIQPQYEEWKLQ